MKKLILALVIVLSPFLAKAQSEFETIGGSSGKVRISGFAGPMMEFTQIDEKFAHMMGGGGGVIINNFFFGGYGMGLTTEQTFRGEASYNLTYGHGGFWLGYTFKHNKAIHPVFHTQIGWGKIGKRPKNIEVEPDYAFGDRVFVFTPTIEVEMNFSRFFKLGVGANYHFVYNTGELNSPYRYEDFANPSIFLSLKFGWFR